MTLAYCTYIIQVMNKTFTNSRGTTYTIELTDKGWTVTRPDTMSTVKVTKAMVDKTQIRLQDGEDIPFRKISYTVAIEQAVIHILSFRLQVHVDKVRKVYTQGTPQYKLNFAQDRRCCTVNTLSHIAGIPFEIAQQELAKVGRKKNHGLGISKWLPVYKKFCDLNDINKASGYKFSGMQVRTFLNNYEHSDMTLVIQTSGHVFPVINGKVKDWMKTNRRHQICNVWVSRRIKN